MGEVTGVNALAGNTIDLSMITSNYTAVDGDILTGTLGTGVQISIADGATVTLRSVNINGNDATYFIGGGSSEHCCYVKVGGVSYEEGGNRGITSSTPSSIDLMVGETSVVYMP